MALVPRAPGVLGIVLVSNWRRQFVFVAGSDLFSWSCGGSQQHGNAHGSVKSMPACQSFTLCQL